MMGRVPLFENEIVFRGIKLEVWYDTEDTPDGYDVYLRRVLVPAIDGADILPWLEREGKFETMKEIENLMRKGD